MPPQHSNQLDLVQLLGNGTSGDVWKAKWKNEEGEFAAKILKKDNIVNTREAVYKEINFLKKMNHKHVLRYHKHFETKTKFVIISELAKGGTLYEQLQNMKSFSEKDAAGIIKQLVEALVYLHNNGVIHRDLKPQNILLKNDPSSSNSLYKNAILLGDFGVATIMINNVASGMAGTSLYIAPEVFNNSYTEKVDMWSLGVIVHELLLGKPPFTGNSQREIFMQIRDKLIEFNDKEWYDISDEAKQFIYKCLNRDPKTRMSAEAALEDDWIKKYADGAGATNNFKALDVWKRGINEIIKRNKVNKARIKKETEVIANELSSATFTSTEDLGNWPTTNKVKIQRRQDAHIRVCVNSFRQESEK